MPHFSIRVVPSAMTKVVISVSKKVSKKAVIRNRIRRRVRPILRSLIKSLKPAVYFISAKRGDEDIKSKELETELLRLIRSIRN